MNDDQSDQREMPRYRCHKEVHALKIAEIEYIEGGGGAALIHSPAPIHPQGNRIAPVEVSAEYMEKHDPQPGGYYVVYKGGYQSFSPAEAFEEGYTRV